MSLGTLDGSVTRQSSPCYIYLAASTQLEATWFQTSCQCRVAVESHCSSTAWFSVNVMPLKNLIHKLSVQLNAFLKADLLILGIFFSTKAVTCYRRATVEAVEGRLISLIVVMAFISNTIKSV